MSEKETFTNKFEEIKGGRVPPKSKIWREVFYGWSLRAIAQLFVAFSEKLNFTASLLGLLRYNLK